MRILKWIRKKVLAEVEFKGISGIQVIGRYEKALVQEAFDQVEGDQVILAVVRNYDGRKVPALCVYAPGGEGRTIGLASVDEKSGEQRKLQE